MNTHSTAVGGGDDVRTFGNHATHFRLTRLSPSHIAQSQPWTTKKWVDEGKGWVLLLGCKLEVTALEHGGGKPGHNLLSLDVQVTIKFVGAAPAPNHHADPVGTDPRAEERHGAIRSRRAS